MTYKDYNYLRSKYASIRGIPFCIPKGFRKLDKNETMQQWTDFIRHDDHLEPVFGISGEKVSKYGYFIIRKLNDDKKECESGKEKWEKA